MFGVVLKTLRKIQGLTQSEFAEEMNLNPVTVNRYENEKRFPDIDTLIAIADYFDVPLDVLVGREWPAGNICAGAVPSDSGADRSAGALEISGSGAPKKVNEESCETGALEHFMKDEAYIGHMLNVYKTMHKDYGIALSLSGLSDSSREKVIDYYDLVCNSEKVK